MLLKGISFPVTKKWNETDGFLENFRRFSFMEALTEISLIFTNKGNFVEGKDVFNQAFRKEPGRWGIDFHETGNYASGKEIYVGIPADVNYLIIPRLVVSGIGSSLSLTFDTIEDLKIALSEACSNVIKHAYQLNKTGNNITIKFLIQKGSLSMVVKDTGKGFDTKILNANNVPLSRGKGLGLFLIKSLMDKVQVNSIVDQGTEVKMIKFLTN